MSHFTTPSLSYISLYSFNQLYTFQSTSNFFILRSIVRSVSMNNMNIISECQSECKLCRTLKRRAILLFFSLSLFLSSFRNCSISLVHFMLHCKTHATSNTYKYTFCDTYWPYFKTYTIFTRINNYFVWCSANWNLVCAFLTQSTQHFTFQIRFHFVEIDAAFKLLPPITEFLLFFLSVELHAFRQYPDELSEMKKC